MKIKKWLATVLGCTLAVSTAACAGVFAACGNGDEKNPSPGGETTPAYQFLGMMDDDDLSSYGMQCALWLQLDSDGTASIDKYSYLSYDASPAAENKNYQADFMVGTWEKTERDGVEGVSIEVGVKQEDGSMKGVTTAMAYNRGGKYSCELTIPIVVDMFDRGVEFEGTEGALYEDADEFITENALTFTPPANETTLTSDNGGTVYVQSEGKLLIYNGYNMIAEGTYENDGEGNMSVTVGATKIDATVDADADTVSFTYEYALYGDYTMTFEFSGKYSEIPVAEAGEPEVQENVYTGTYNGQTWTLTIKDATTCTMSTQMGGFDVPFNGTYVKDEQGVVTVTCNPSNETMQSIWAGVKNVKWQLNEADHTMTAIAE